MLKSILGFLMGIGTPPFNPPAYPNIVQLGALNTNFWLYSAPDPSNVLAVSGQMVAPDNTNTGFKIVCQTTGYFKLISEFYAANIANSGPDAGKITVLFWVKKGNSATVGNQFLVRNMSLGVNLLGIALNYDSGTWSYDFSTDGSHGVVDVSSDLNGWYRVAFTMTNYVSNGDLLRFYDGFTGGPQTINDHFYAWIQE